MHLYEEDVEFVWNRISPISYAKCFKVDVVYRVYQQLPAKLQPAIPAYIWSEETRLRHKT